MITFGRSYCTHSCSTLCTASHDNNIAYSDPYFYEKTALLVPEPRWYRTTSALPGFPEEARGPYVPPPRLSGVNLGMRWREYQRRL